jgi:hypothetical protein
MRNLLQLDNELRHSTRHSALCMLLHIHDIADVYNTPYFSTRPWTHPCAD